MEFLFGSLAGTVAGVITNPLEVVKTRMQLQGELTERGKHVKLYKNAAHATYLIAKNEGVLALQKGLLPFIGWQIVANGIRLGLYDIIYNSGFMTDENNELVFFKTVFIGAFCGGIAGYFANPFFLVKTHLQARSPDHLALGSQRNYSGTFDAFRTIYKKEGVNGWFRGSITCATRTTVGSTAQLTSFYYVKEIMSKNGILPNSPLGESFVASMVGGVAISLFMSPFDLILTRLYSQETVSGKGILYRGFFDCMSKILKTEGPFGLFKGMGATYIRMAPHTVLSLVFWDEFRRIYEMKNGKKTN